MKRYQTRMGLAVGLAVVGMPLTVDARHSRPSLQLRQTSPLEQATELNQQVIERYQAAIPLAEEALAIPQLLAADRHPDLTTSLNNLAGLLSASSGSMFPVKTNPSSPQLAQVTPITITSKLDETSQTTENGSHFNIDSFERTAGEAVRIDLSSEDFDTVLVLLDPDRNIIATDDNSGAGTNSQISLTIPVSGLYFAFISASAYSAESTGDYQLTLQSATADDISRFAELRRAKALNEQVTELYEAGRYDEAASPAQEALEIRQMLLAPNDPDIAASLGNLAQLYRARGLYSEAETLYLQSLEIYQTTLNSDHPLIVASLSNLAGLYQDQGRYGEAEQLYLQALEIRQTALDSDHPLVATSLNNLALLYQDQGRYGEAESLYLRALEIRQRVLDHSHPAIATSFNNLATLYQAQGRYREAESLYLQSREIRQAALDPNHPDIASSFNNLAKLYQDQGRYSEAETLLQQALEIYQTALGPNHPDVALSFNNLAGLYKDQGRYSEAETLYLQALEIWKTRLDSNHPYVATTLTSLAGLYQDQGRYSEAEPLYLQSLEIYQGALGPNHPYVATGLDNLAALYFVQRRYSKAESSLLQALEIRQRSLNPNHPDIASSLNALALLHLVQGRYSEAEPLFQQVLEIYQTALSPNHPDVAVSLNNLAGLYQDQGRYGEAEPLFQRALEIWQTVLNPDHPSVANSLMNLAASFQAQGDWEQAVSYVQQGLSIEEENLELNLATLTESQRQDYTAILTGSTSRAISLSLQTDEAAELGLTTLLRRKGRVLEAGSSSLQRLRQNLTLADQTVLDDFIAVQQRRATLTFNPNLSPEQRSAQLAQLKAQATDLEKTLAQRSAVFRVETQPVDMATVQAQIPTDGVLVEYVRYRPFDAKAEPANRFGSPRYAAYLLFPNGNITTVDLGPAADIDTAVLSLSDGLANAQPVDKIHRRAQALNARVIAPLRASLEGVEHLLISPDGALNQIPFEVLRSNRGQYLIETFEISYLTSGRDLLKLGLIPPSPNPALILAAPNYGEIVAAAPDDNGQRSVDLASLTVNPLQYAFREGRALSALLPDADFLTGRSATETALKQVSSPRLLHIATHGLFLEDAPRRQENRDTEGTAFSDTYEVPIENPLLRAMLALEGFNARKSGQEDGVLTALEAANLNLYGTQLVVLSACETAQGEVVSGEGVYGLRRAFTLAGAESLVMSLWHVKDDSTQELMVGYYDNLLSGMDRSEALRQVQREMIHSDDYSHPYYWAAFVLTGDWRPLKQ